MATVCEETKMKREEQIIENTKKFNEPIGSIYYEKMKNKELCCKYFETIGRLIKYEGMNIFEEVFQFAIKNEVSVFCSSAILGVKSKICYTTHQNVRKAHYSIDNHYLFPVNDEIGFLPVKYKGKFLIKQFETKFRSLLHTEVKEGYSYEKIEDYFNI